MPVLYSLLPLLLGQFVLFQNTKRKKYIVNAFVIKKPKYFQSVECFRSLSVIAMTQSMHMLTLHRTKTTTEKIHDKAWARTRWCAMSETASSLKTQVIEVMLLGKAKTKFLIAYITLIHALKWILYILQELKCFKWIIFWIEKMAIPLLTEN